MRYVEYFAGQALASAAVDELADSEKVATVCRLYAEDLCRLLGVDPDVHIVIHTVPLNKSSDA